MARNFVTGGPKQAGDGVAREGNSEREDLANFISMITRDETPFMSSIGKTKATAILHEWQTDELTAPYANRVQEGVTYTMADSATPDEPFRSRLSNYTQIGTKVLDISGTKRAVDQAGVADEYAYQLKKRGTELRRDLEVSLIHANQSSSGTGTRSMGGYQAYIDSGNVLEVNTTAAYTAGNGAGTSGTWTDGTAGTGGSAASPSFGTTQTRSQITLTNIDELMQTIYQEGGKATKVMVSPKVRRDISSQAQQGGTGAQNTGNVRRNIDADGSLRQSVDIYMSDFGELMVVPNYIMGLDFIGDEGTTTGPNFGRPAAANNASNGEAGANTRDAFALVYDPMWFSIATLRPLQEIDLGQVGDTTIGQIVEECTLEVRNPRGFGLIAGLE